MACNWARIGAHIVGRMFGIDEEPIEAGGGTHFSRVWIGLREPEAV
jgi:hypothetical protein